MFLKYVAYLMGNGTGRIPPRKTLLRKFPLVKLPRGKFPLVKFPRGEFRSGIFPEENSPAENSLVFTNTFCYTQFIKNEA